MVWAILRTETDNQSTYFGLCITGSAKVKLLINGTPGLGMGVGLAFGMDVDSVSVLFDAVEVLSCPSCGGEGGGITSSGSVALLSLVGVGLWWVGG